jgi:glutamate---cysteine ligase / carboxylate-amine ligase
VRSGAIPDPGFLWWDVRLQPRLGTVEVRIMDAQSRVADVAALAALVQCLVRRHGDQPASAVATPETLAENRFLAARDGMSAWFIDGSGRSRRPAADALGEMLELCRPAADALGCAAELWAAAVLTDDAPYGRQRLVAARDGIEAVPAELAGEFIGAGTTLAAA